MIKQIAKGIFRDVCRAIEAKMAKAGDTNLLDYWRRDLLHGY